MSVIASVHGVLGAHRYSQEEITGSFGKIVSPQGKEIPVIARIHRATALNEAGLSAEDVDFVMATSVTGVATPSLEARLVPIVGFRPDVKRVPIFGLGCVAGAAGIARIHDYLSGHPDDVAVLLSVELCSLTRQSDDVSIANIIASGLFGDTAAVVVMVGERRAVQMRISGPRVIASRSRMYPDTEQMIGWNIGSSGFRIVLSASVGDVITRYLGDDMDAFLSDHDLKTTEIEQWVAHAGGPKILQAIEESLNLRDGQLEASWHSLYYRRTHCRSALFERLRSRCASNDFARYAKTTGK